MTTNLNQDEGKSIKKAVAGRFGQCRSSLYLKFLYQLLDRPSVVRELCAYCWLASGRVVNFEEAVRHNEQGRDVTVIVQLA